MISCERIDCSEDICLDKITSSVKCMICNYYYFKMDYQPYVCNSCHDFSMTVQVLSDFFILNVKGVDYRVHIANVDKKDAVNILDNSNLSDQGVLYMDFGTNISPVEIIKKGAFGGTYFRDIYSGVNGKFHKDSWKEFKELESIDKTHYSSDFYDVSLNFYKVKCGTSLRFWEKKDWINEIDPYGWFQWYFRY